MFVSIDPEIVIRSAFEMPPLPQSAVRLAGIIANDEIELGEVVQVIECDPALTLKLLRVANSVYSSSSRPIGTVKDAVIRLGTGAILGLAVGACVQPNIHKVIPGYNILRSDFWRHSLAAAMATESLRSFSKQRISPLAFTSALLHDIGKIVLGHYLDTETLDLLERASRDSHLAVYQAESEILSLHHGEVGGVVAQHWGLPETIVKGIAFHHEPENCDDAIGIVTHFANYVAHQVAPMTVFGHTEVAPHEPEDVSSDMKHFGLTDVHTSKIFLAVKDRLAAIAADYA